ncbi:uncharacterized protein LOC111620600 [Centruroides sculpturatus]|uniref:uncharacterized protein LOC111620600 n=1 Tax=Centruroides sculpturatus TaxID=218467 RepID=UPI000C6D47C2|nr:uncharacterized protein LOC111620600 [Centruroides sculpturatus]
MRRVLDNWDRGISIRGHKVNNLRYTDNKLIIAFSESELEYIIKHLETESREYGLLINESKIKVMIIDCSLTQTMEIAGYKVVNEFVYLRSFLTNKGECNNEIKCRICLAHNTTSKLFRIWKNSAITIFNKLKLIRTLIFPIVTYASETWTINATSQKKLDSLKLEDFEIWTYRRMLRIYWMEHQTNCSILNQLKIITRLTTKIYQSYLRFLGYISRCKNGFEKQILEGKINGKHTRGRCQIRWADQVIMITGHTIYEAIYMAQHQE